MPLGTPAVETEPSAEADLSQRPIPEGEGQPIRILVVDDAERNLAALGAMLADLDAQVVTARSGNDALRALLRHDFSLILLDVRMPGMDGFETAGLIRSRDRSRLTPIIFLSAFDRSREDELRGYALGAADFVSKPIVPEVLRGKIAVLIELQRKTDEVRRQAALLEETRRREHVRALEVERRRWEQEALRIQVERERQAAETLQRANARLRLLSDTASDLLLAAEPAPESTLGEPLFSRVASHLGLELGAWHRREDDGTLVLESAAGFTAAELEAFRRIERRSGALAEAAETQRRLVLDSRDRAVAAGMADLRAVFPIFAGARLHGVLSFGTRSGRALEVGEVAALELVARAVSATLDRWRLLVELRERAAELKEADARKDQFLAMLGHELRNPLAPVLNAIKLVQHRDSVDASVRRVVAAADRQIGQMTRLLDDLLDLSRIRNGKIELRRRRVDVREVIRDVVSAAESAVAERGHELTVGLPPHPLPVGGDPVRLAQAFGNLLHNAVKYTDRGGHLHLSAERRGGEVVVTVVDDGVGIPGPMLESIFDMFVQVEQGADRSGGGLGLGLTLVRSLVELHGGRIAARSEGGGCGSEFEVTLPALAGEELAAEVAAAPVLAPRRGADPSRPLDIVLVEDNADIRESLRALLELHGHVVSEAIDGVSGIDLIRSRTPSVALVDIGLPGLDGYEVANALRDAPTRLVAMTGYGRPEDRRRALEAGFHAHLVKPVDFDDLARLLDELACP